MTDLIRMALHLGLMVGAIFLIAAFLSAILCSPWVLGWFLKRRGYIHADNPKWHYNIRTRLYTAVLLFVLVGFAYMILGRSWGSVELFFEILIATFTVFYVICLILALVVVGVYAFGRVPLTRLMIYTAFILLVPWGVRELLVMSLTPTQRNMAPREAIQGVSEVRKIELLMNGENPVEGKKIVFDGEVLRIEMGWETFKEFYGPTCSPEHQPEMNKACRYRKEVEEVLQKVDEYVVFYDPKAFVPGPIGDMNCVSCYGELKIEHAVGYALESGNFSIFNKVRNEYEEAIDIAVAREHPKYANIGDFYETKTAVTTEGILIYGPSRGFFKAFTLRH